jgi:hypothetical protein
LGDKELVWGVLRDLETSALDEKHKALFRFVDKVNHDSPRITAADMVPLRELGWTDEAIYFAITVCALFNFYNRWIDASGVHALSDAAHEEGGRRSAKHGYVRPQSRNYFPACGTPRSPAANRRTRARSRSPNPIPGTARPAASTRNRTSPPARRSPRAKQPARRFRIEFALVRRLVALHHPRNQQPPHAPESRRGWDRANRMCRRARDAARTCRGNSARSSSGR